MARNGSDDRQQANADLPLPAGEQGCFGGARGEQDQQNVRALAEAGSSCLGRRGGTHQFKIKSNATYFRFQLMTAEWGLLSIVPPLDIQWHLRSTQKVMKQPHSKL
jgi:hypothetical protein